MRTRKAGMVPFIPVSIKWRLPTFPTVDSEIESSLTTEAIMTNNIAYGIYYPYLIIGRINTVGTISDLKMFLILALNIIQRRCFYINFGFSD
jgi:hypothetical protein